MRLRRLLSALIWVFVAFMVIGRLVSGVHWLSDIIGGALLSTGLVMLYDTTVTFITMEEMKEKENKQLDSMRFIG